MEIRIKRIATQTRDGDVSDITNTYAVTDNGKEFTIMLRTYRHGCNLGIAGQEGTLYTDSETNTVHRHVVSIGPACGWSVKVDEVIAGLSPWAIRGVIIAERSGQEGEIVVSGQESASDEPLVLLNGKAVDIGEYF